MVPGGKKRAAGVVWVRRLVLAPRGLTGLLNPYVRSGTKLFQPYFENCFNCASPRAPVRSVIQPRSLAKKSPAARVERGLAFQGLTVHYSCLSLARPFYDGQRAAEPRPTMRLCYASTNRRGGRVTYPAVCGKWVTPLDNCGSAHRRRNRISDRNVG
jgi:hypothetical protein